MNMFFTQMAILATTKPNAVNEVLNDDRYEGAIEEIQPFTQLVDKVGVIFITGTAFLIITVAIWRNVLAGAYAAFPKFWDQVHVAHDEVKDLGWIQRIQGIRQNAQGFNMGTLKRMLMRICPDVKVLTDFEDDTVEPKTYFTKAIAQMIAVVLIGVFIYNGYYRDVTVQVANFGSEMFERVIMGTDPVEIFDRVLNTAGKPEFSTDNALDTLGQRENEISKTIYNKLIGKYTDISTAKDKAAMASAIETNVSAWVNSATATDSKNAASASLKDYLSKEEYKMSVDCAMTTNATTLSPYATSSNGNMVSFATSWDATTFNLNTTKYTDETWYATCVIVLEKTNKKNKDTDFYDVQMTVNAASKNGAWEFTTAKDEGQLYTQGNCVITIGSTKYRVEVTANGISSTDGKSLPTSTNGPVSVSGLKYKCGTQDNLITTIQVINGSAGTPTFKSSSAEGDVQLGQKFVAKDKDSDSTETKTE